MPADAKRRRIVRAVHGIREQVQDPAYVAELAKDLAAKLGRDGLLELYHRHQAGEDPFSQLVRRVVVKAVARRCGHGLVVSSGVGFKHLETMVFGDRVFLGAGAYLQGRFDGRCVIGDNVWIGPQAYFDARDLVLEDYVGWGPGAKVLGSAHTGIPADVPIVQTDLVIEPVRVRAWADIGTNAVLLPGVTVGKGAIVGAGAVVTRDVPPFGVVAGVPARLLRSRRPQRAAPRRGRRG